MKTFEERQCLESMEIIVDTREQETDRSSQRYAAFQVPWKRGVLSYGDYTYNFTLPSGKPYFDETETLSPLCVVERKMNLTELSGCFTQSRERFQREFERAKKNGSRVILLVENATWENLLNGKYRTKFNPKSFFASLTAWMVRYDLQVVFCKEETSGRMIRELLYRDLKERIEGGEFDGWMGENPPRAAE